MSIIRRLSFCFLAGMISGALTFSMAWAQSTGKPHEYRTLQSPDAKHSRENVPLPPKPLMVSKPVQPYAYGWFGSKPSMHWHRQFGNRRIHTQWTLK